MLLLSENFQPLYGSPPSLKKFIASLYPAAERAPGSCQFEGADLQAAAAQLGLGFTVLEQEDKSADADPAAYADATLPLENNLIQSMPGTHRVLVRTIPQERRTASGAVKRKRASQLIDDF